MWFSFLKSKDRFPLGELRFNFLFNRVDLATCSIYDVSMFCITPLLTLYTVSLNVNQSILFGSKIERLQLFCLGLGFWKVDSLMDFCHRKLFSFILPSYS
ncbi:unnamed protein product [Brassica oleracea var. botrytis]|uniref:(rape) hypothetical protein n=1 Tax=Brassica napus TaxID=3708 RepID=A0A816KZI3_BRANA|nr:unnamed protein product [Brassica napus]